MKIKKIIAGIVALILIVVIIFFANAFVGNPISKMLVNQSAKKYVQQNYSDLNLELDKANYNFKDGNYFIYVKSKTSIDTHFSINFTGTGKFIRDNYESYVLGKFNTWERINTEYRKLVDTVVENDFPYESDIAFGEIFDKGDGLDELEIDKEYDIKAMARERGHIVIYITSNTLDGEALMRTLVDVKELFDQKEVPFYSIDFTLQVPLLEDKIGRESIGIKKFLYEDIHEDNLQERVNQNIKATKGYYEQKDKEREIQINNENNK